MTWKEMKLATLQKMFSANGTTIPEDTATTDYLAGMSQVCNEALQLLSTAGKFIVKSIEIANNPIDNVLSDDYGKYITQLLEETEIVASSGKAYTFNYTGQGTLVITVGSVETTVTLDKTTYYKTYNGLITNDDDEEVTFTFTPTYPSAIKDFGVYAVTFENTDSIPTYEKKIKYNLDEMVDDFYQLRSGEIYFEGSKLDSRYINSNDYFQEGNKVFVIDREKAGNFTIYYNAYPGEITQDQSDDYEFPLDNEVAILPPLYMASQLFKDDDPSLSATYRNEFEVARSELSPAQTTPSAEGFTSESGWL